MTVTAPDDLGLGPLRLHSGGLQRLDKATEGHTAEHSSMYLLHVVQQLTHFTVQAL